MLWSMLVTAILCNMFSLLYGSGYEIGAGIFDITGPVAEIQFFGYATFNQSGAGLHLRQFSRCFIISDGNNRVVLVTAEIGAVSQMVRTEVINQLQGMYGDLYTVDNVCLSATHTHSGPGSYFQYTLYSAISFGFNPQSFYAIVDGIVQSIRLAHESMQPGNLYYNEGTLLNANINRSPTSYLLNPANERAQYPYDVDKTMQLLKMTATDGTPIGVITWFPVHGTSMNHTNLLVSSDNKGYAAIKSEQSMNGNNLIGTGPFVAAFAQGSQGDVSPNTLGPRCIDSGDPCDPYTSTCHGLTSLCIAFGPGKNMFQSTEIIGQLQFEAAMALFNNATEEIQGSIQFIHQHLDMTSIITSSGNTAQVNRTCRAAMGVGFAGGTTDGPGVNPFSQGVHTNPFWDYVVQFIVPPPASPISCQLPKPILFDTGDLYVPYPWQPKILPTQILKIGNIIILPVAAEFSTMSGRRMVSAVTSVVQAESPIENLHVLVQSHSNAYSSYVTTYEEYQAQRYESASTIYGPHTLEAYMLQYQALAKNMVLNESVSPGPIPPFLLAKQIQFVPNSSADSPGLGKHFGQVLQDVKQQYSHGDTVSCLFVSGNPRNSVLISHNFLNIDMYNSATTKWQTVATDANWETKFQWTRPLLGLLTGQSQVNVTWYIPTQALPGIYRIVHFGYSKNLFRQLQNYTGTSSSFTVLAT